MRVRGLGEELGALNDATSRCIRSLTKDKARIIDSNRSKKEGLLLWQSESTSVNLVSIC